MVVLVISSRAIRDRRNWHVVFAHERTHVEREQDRPSDYEIEPQNLIKPQIRSYTVVDI